MVQRVQVVLFCDLHGDGDTPGEQTVTFGLEGASYEIDLCADHLEELRGAMAPFVGNGRRVGGRGGGGRRGGDRSDRSDGARARSAEIREWARAAGVQVSDRGRIPADVVARFQAERR